MNTSPLTIAPLLGAFIAFTSSAIAEQNIGEDLTVTGGLCAGVSCGFGDFFIEGARIKSPQPTIVLDDTDIIGDFQWGIAVNAFSSGFDSFHIRDYTGSNSYVVPFVIRNNAPGVSLAIAETGNIGLGTAMAEKELHLVDDNAPTIRLEQTAASGMGQHKWDIVANNTGFLIVDPAATSIFTRVPFVIENGAPSRSFYMTNEGALGLGTDTPEVPFHVVENAGTATDILRLENNGGVVFRLKDTSPGGQEFTFQSNGGIFRIASPAVPGPEFTMDDFGNVTIKGEITTAGSCSAGCDRVFDEDYDLPEMEAHHAAMWELGYLPNVGPTAEDAPMNLSDKVGGMLNELEHAHIYIGQLKAEIAVLQERDAIRDQQMQKVLDQLAQLAAQ